MLPMQVLVHLSHDGSQYSCEQYSQAQCMQCIHPITFVQDCGVRLEALSLRLPQPDLVTHVLQPSHVRAARLLSWHNKRPTNQLSNQLPELLDASVSTWGTVVRVAIYGRTTQKQKELPASAVKRVQGHAMLYGLC